MAFTFPTSANQLQAFAGALYGVQIGSATMAQVTSDIAAVGGLNNALNNYYAASFSGVPTATVAASVATNLGLTGDLLTAGTAYVAAQLNAAAPSARGVVIKEILNLFSNLAADKTFGAAATAWNTKVAAAATYTGAVDVVMGSNVGEGKTFTLSVGLDNRTGTGSNDTFDGSLNTTNQFATLNSGDMLDGGEGNDSLFAVLPVGTYAPTLTSIESVTVVASGAATLDLGGSTGVKAFVSQGAAAALTVSGITVDTSVSIANSANNTTLTYAGVTGAQAHSASQVKVPTKPSPAVQATTPSTEPVVLTTSMQVQATTASPSQRQLSWAKPL